MNTFYLHATNSDGIVIPDLHMAGEGEQLYHLMIRNEYESSEFDSTPRNITPKNLAHHGLVYMLHKLTSGEAQIDLYPTVQSLDDFRSPRLPSRPPRPITASNPISSIIVPREQDTFALVGQSPRQGYKLCLFSIVTIL